MREVTLPALSWLSAAAMALLLSAGPAAAQPASANLLPVFDVHLHGSHDAWERLPPIEAVALQRQAGLKQAMASSRSDEGTQKPYAAAPDLVLPVLRPYRTRGEMGRWVRNASVIARMEARLRQYRCVALGEYHVYGADADLPDRPVVRRVVQRVRSAPCMHDGSVATVEYVVRHNSKLDEEGMTPTANAFCGRSG